jgi:D-psicose/D-tagatose/L-ribulose 3-epimerase
VGSDASVSSILSWDTPLSIFINLAEQATEVVDRVDNPACKIILDTYHMNIEEKSFGDVTRSVGSRLAQVHTCENERGTMVTSHIDWDEAAQILRDINYNGALGIGLFTPKMKSISRTIGVWRPTVSSPDALAGDDFKILEGNNGVVD